MGLQASDVAHPETESHTAAVCMWLYVLVCCGGIVLQCFRRLWENENDFYMLTDILTVFFFSYVPVHASPQVVHLIL